MQEKNIYVTENDVKRLQALLTEGKISVLAPIGTAMLGYRAGDTFSWQVPAGIRRIKILAILYQPEASGDYHL